jgi:hypothetical protein
LSARRATATAWQWRTGIEPRHRNERRTLDDVYPREFRTSGQQYETTPQPVQAPSEESALLLVRSDLVFMRTGSQALFHRSPQQPDTHAVCSEWAFPVLEVITGDHVLPVG